jgi:hypothetical protein
MTMLMKNRLPLIVACVVIIIVIIFLSLWILGAFPTGIAIPAEKPVKNSTPGFNYANFSVTKLPSELQREIWHLEENNHFTVGKWEYYSKDHTVINLYASDILNESAISDLQGKQIGNYTIHIIRETEFEATRAEVRRQLMQYREDPAYEIHTTMN